MELIVIWETRMQVTKTQQPKYSDLTQWAEHSDLNTVTQTQISRYTND